MKKINNWWIPDTETSSEVITRIENEIWTCRNPLEKCFRYCKNFDKAIDIGAWIGDSTELISKKFNTVFAFEPNIDVYECCLKNLKDRCINNVVLHNLAISNMKGNVPFKFPRSTLSAWIDTTDNQNIDAFVQSELLDNLNFEGIDFIKIDVDSHEGFLLEGAKKFFQYNNPLIMIEHKPKTLKRQKDKMPNALQTLRDLGYRLIEKASKIDYIFERT